MPSQNVACVLRIFDAVNAGDVQTAVAELADDAVVDFSRSHSPYRGIYEGRAEIERFWSSWVGDWERLSWSAEAISEVPPDRVVLVNHLTGRGRGSGIEIDARGGHVWEVADGRVRRMALFQTLEDAQRNALG